MLRYRLLALVILFPISATLIAAEADDRKNLNGVWKGWVVEGKGEFEKQRRIRMQMTIKGNTITAVEDGTKDLGEGTFTLKFDKQGKFMDATRTKGQQSGQTYKGIYSLEGNTLKWCVSNPPGRDRPGELQSKTGQFLMIMTKEK